MTYVRHRLLALSSVALLTSLAGPAAHADTFDDGDFYILTFDWPGLGAAVARIDPAHPCHSDSTPEPYWGRTR